MSSSRIEKLPYQATLVSSQNPLPDMGEVRYVHAKVLCDDTVPEDYRTYIGYGRVNSILPYRAQDGYDRNLKECDLETVVIENEHVRAEFLPFMGARLWSLRVDGREMLYKNAVIQPCNLALRNAWCAGGVEWNVGVRGHNMLTFETMFTELFTLDDGTAGARFYEYERLRGIVYRLEAYLPPQSRLLMVQVTIENPEGNGHTPAYWWSNIAVEEYQDMRVLAPATHAVFSTYNEGSYQMTRQSLPHFAGCDVSRPLSATRSLDVFYDIDAAQRPYIAALTPDGTGLVQLSTKQLCGRKLFLWGSGTGGRHWQDWLSHGHGAYIEIQAGLTRTQQEYLPMDEGTKLSWLEAYGSVSCQTQELEYDDAVSALEKQLAPAFAALDEEKARAERVARVKGELVILGSGWGAIENERRLRAGMPPVSEVCVFPEITDDASAPWHTLLFDGYYPDKDPAEMPDDHLTRAFWRERLESAPANAASQYQLGVLRFACGDRDGAKLAFEHSLQIRENAWALCGLAKLAKGEEDYALAAEYYRRALALLPACRNILVEYAIMLMNLEQHQELLKLLDDAHSSLRLHPRVQFLRAAALIGLERIDEAEAILTAPLEMADIQEGECSFDKLWRTIQDIRERRDENYCRKELPYALDFRMH